MDTTLQILFLGKGGKQAKAKWESKNQSSGTIGKMLRMVVSAHPFSLPVQGNHNNIISSI